MRQVSTSLGRLQRLSARQCPGLALNAVRGFPALRSLDLSGCDAIAPNVSVGPTYRAACMLLLAAGLWSSMQACSLQACRRAQLYLSHSRASGWRILHSAAECTACALYRSADRLLMTLAGALMLHGALAGGSTEHLHILGGSDTGRMHAADSAAAVAAASAPGLHARLSQPVHREASSCTCTCA